MSRKPTSNEPDHEDPFFEKLRKGDIVEGKPSKLRRKVSGVRVAIYLPPDIEQQLRVRCAADRRSISDAVTEGVIMWLFGYRKKSSRVIRHVTEQEWGQARDKEAPDSIHPCNYWDSDQCDCKGACSCHWWER